MQKKILEKVFYGTCSACLIWLGASVANVNCHNLNDCEYAKWNVFNLVKLANAKELELENDTGTVVEFVAEPVVETDKQMQRGEWVSTMQEQKAEQLKADTMAEKKAQKKAEKQVAKETAMQDDIYRLAQIMMAENGQNEEAAILTGVVVLKRVKSEYFPNTIAEVIAEAGQYDSYRNGSALTIEPNEMCMECAEELLRFDLADDYPDGLVFQAEFIQGSSVYRHVGNQYFCLM